MTDRDARLARIYPAVVLLAVAAGLLLRLPALENGMVSDDFVEEAMLEGVYPTPRSPLDLFNFTDGRPEDVRALMDYGALPWWTVDGLRLAMMRPLASALILFDHEVLGRDAFARHLHSAFWWITTMLVVAALFRRLLPPVVACFAMLVFALEEGHTLPLGWLANRGALVAMTLGLAGLLAHLRYRLDAWRPGRPWSWVLFGLALACGEWAFPILGYVLAFELVRVRDPWRLRLRALLPAALSGAVFLASRSLLGYGALRSGVYIDPFTEPLDFAVACLQRIPVLFADLLFSVPAVWWDFGTPWRNAVLSWGLFSPEVWIRLPGWRVWHVALGTLALALSLVIVRWGLRGAAAGLRAELRWLLVGALLSLVPMVASFPTSRLVLPASVAASALVAAVVLQGVRYVASSRHRTWRRALSALIVAGIAYLQLVEAGRTSAEDTHWSHHFYSATRRWVREAGLHQEGIENKRVVVLGTNEHTTAVFTPFARWYYGAPLPASFHTLVSAPQAFDVHRPKDNVLEITVLAGTFLESDMEKLYRSDKYPLRVGDMVEVDGMRVEILRLMNDKPQRVRFVFEHSLDDPRYVVLSSTIFGLRRVPVPEWGQTRRYKRPTFPDHNVIDAALKLMDANSSCVVRPPIDQCRYGHAFADCGGQGDPVFACHGFGDCRWFVGGCVAEGYLSSSCSAQDVCCYGGWPYDEEDEVFHSGGLRRAVQNTLAAWGGRPFGADRQMNLEVEEDPAMLSQDVELRCRGDFDGDGPCDLSLVRALPPHHGSFALSYQAPVHRGGWGVTLEVVRDREGVTRGRVCRISVPRYLEGACPGPGTPECAIAGEIVLRALPGHSAELLRVTGRFTADFGGGRLIEGAF